MKTLEPIFERSRSDRCSGDHRRNKSGVSLREGSAGKRPSRGHLQQELVATHGAELLALARQKGVCFLFEASVGGGTPSLPMYQCLAANNLSEVRGIVNGTTNFMLTKMEQGHGF